MGVQKVIHRRYERTEPVWNFMKFYKIIKFWAKEKYGLSSPDLELLFFIYSEGLFSKSDFIKFSEVFPWDSTRFNRLRQEGWIVRWRNATKGEKALYEISFKGKHAITSIYKKMTGDPISENSQKNSMFVDRDATYSTKVYRTALLEMNKEYKERNAKMINGRPANIPSR